MTETESKELWNKITAVLEDQLQYGFLEKAKFVVRAYLENSTLILEVNDDEAFEFFNSQITQQRILIISRPIANIATVQVNRVPEE